MPESPSEVLTAALALNLVKGIGPRIQAVILECFGSPEAFFRASLSEVSQVPGIGKKILQQLDTNNFLDMARRELADCQSHNIDVVSRDNPRYPQSLLEIPDAPLILYERGKLQPTDQLAVAIVGSRNCTGYGQRIATRFAGGLARAGITIVSGLARGIDGFAHRAALQAGGRTIAVCANGLRKMYPPEHTNLAEEISRAGAVISESPLLQEPTRGLFPQRNRIVSGMSLGVVVIEASGTSGTLHTARHAMEQNRDVFAVPGQIDSRESEGCHNLIRDGAKLVRNIDDILEELGPLSQPIQIPESSIQKHHKSDPKQNEQIEERTIEVRTPQELNLSAQQSEILNHIGDEPMLVDQLIEQCEIAPSRVLSTLTILEMKRLVQRQSGNRVQRIPR